MDLKRKIEKIIRKSPFTTTKVQENSAKKMIYHLMELKMTRQKMMHLFHMLQARTYKYSPNLMHLFTFQR